MTRNQHQRNAGSLDRPGDLPAGLGAPSPPPRLGWPDVVAVGLILSFIGFLIQYVHLSVQEATLTGVFTGAALVFLLLMPKVFMQLVSALRELNSRLGAGSAI